MEEGSCDMAKKGSLSRKNIIRLTILGIIIVIGTGLAGGIQMYQQNLKIYQEAAESYVNMLLYQSQFGDISKIIEHQDEIIEIQKKYEDYYNNKDKYDEPEEIIEEYDSEAVSAYGDYSSFDSFVVGFGNICTDIRYAYVVIPTEKDLIYVWDSEYDPDHLTIPFEHVPYSGKEKEHILSVMSGEHEGDFFTDRIDGELIGTALCPVYDYENNIRAVAAIDISISSIRSAFLKLVLHVGIAVFLIMLVSITTYHFVVRRQIINPITKLTLAADGLVNNLRDENAAPLKIDVHTGDEIEVLARSFEEMDAKLLNYIQENAVITAEKERIGTELALATRIQADMLPRIFPPFPERNEIDLYASMRPAKEVGGDFYDFFMVDENRLAVVVADVSGKGVPAALFMMMSKIMIQNFALTLDGPGKVLEKVNDRICTNSVEEMFVTVWLGMLDLDTGLLTAANGGHEYPILMKPDGDFELYKDLHGLVIGGIAGYHYREYQLHLEPGSRLFLYTDGLPEATDEKENMFGIERTLSALNEVRDGTPRQVLDHISKSVASFVGGAPQFDDTTMLCLDYYGDVLSQEQKLT